jgi:hypothetical protein
MNIKTIYSELELYKYTTGPTDRGYNIALHINILW